jgi:hypothetical protein
MSDMKKLQKTMAHIRAELQRLSFIVNDQVTREGCLGGRPSAANSPVQPLCRVVRGNSQSLRKMCDFLLWFVPKWNGSRHSRLSGDKKLFIIGDEKVFRNWAKNKWLEQAAENRKFVLKRSAPKSRAARRPTAVRMLVLLNYSQASARRVGLQPGLRCDRPTGARDFWSCKQFLNFNPVKACSTLVGIQQTVESL